MAAFPSKIDIPHFVRDMSVESFTASTCSASENWASHEATPATSPPSSRGESPERKGEVGNRHTRSDTITALPAAPPVKSICFVGAGFVGKNCRWACNDKTLDLRLTRIFLKGGPTAALIAYHNPLITVNVVDLNTERIAAWNSNHLPIHETGLPKIVRTARDGTSEAVVTLPGLESTTIHLPARKPNLFFSCNVTASIAEADIVFICVNTPTKMYGIGAGASADLGALEAATRTIAKHAKAGAVIVEKSTVPCGTARIISDIVSFPSSFKFQSKVPPRALPTTCLSLITHIFHTHHFLPGRTGTRRHPRHKSRVSSGTDYRPVVANKIADASSPPRSSASTDPRHPSRCSRTPSSSPRAPPSPT